jgi:hypothetical protein
MPIENNDLKTTRSNPLETNLRLPQLAHDLIQSMSLGLDLMERGSNSHQLFITVVIFLETKII